eukprot:16644-Pelagococcus_subviridis.AAC.2
MANAHGYSVGVVWPAVFCALAAAIAAASPHTLNGVLPSLMRSSSYTRKTGPFGMNRSNDGGVVSATSAAPAMAASASAFLHTSSGWHPRSPTPGQ